MTKTNMTSKLYTFRKAEEQDRERVWKIIKQAKAQMKRLGSCQWDESYPAIENIQEDIAHGDGYVICLNQQVIAYGVISFDGEPVYNQIIEQWASNLPYVIVHRLAVADEAKHQGIAKKFMLHAEELSREKGICHFRVDTKYDNTYMLRLIDSLGFSYRGNVFYRNNTEERMAFEKSL